MIGRAGRDGAGFALQREDRGTHAASMPYRTHCILPGNRAVHILAANGLPHGGHQVCCSRHRRRHRAHTGGGEPTPAFV